MDNEKLAAALESLNPENNDHWTGDGSPKLESLSSILGEKVSRAMVTEEFPLFNRDFAAESKVEAPATEIETPATENDEDALFDAVDEAENNLMEARGRVDEAAEYLSNAQSKYEEALKARDDAYPPLTNSENIRSYLDQQQEQRIARYANSDAFIRRQDAAFAAKSKIDQAFSAKRRFGAHRPVHPRVAKQG